MGGSGTDDSAQYFILFQRFVLFQGHLVISEKNFLIQRICIGEARKKNSMQHRHFVGLQFASLSNKSIKGDTAYPSVQSRVMCRVHWKRFLEDDCVGL